jgi:hypothetical protein
MPSDTRERVVVATMAPFVTFTIQNAPGTDLDSSRALKNP